MKFRKLACIVTETRLAPVRVSDHHHHFLFAIKNLYTE